MPITCVMTIAELTGLAAADIIHDFLNLMQLDAPPSPPVTRAAWMSYDAKERAKDEL